jgi:nucleoside-diphosphate-sugar epimerase
MSRTLVFGLSGQLGTALLSRLPPGFGRLLALSRQPQAAHEAVEWQLGSLEALGPPPPEVSRILSLGPLDAFAAWVEREQPRLRRIVAIGSTGMHDKRDSPDPRERDDARRLAEAEASLFAFGRARAVAVTVLRPTLLYGSGRDRSLGRLAEFARRWRILPLPASATGRRQPVHVDDVAEAVLACLEAPASFGLGFDLPGGEVLAFDDMVRRALARWAPGARVLHVPSLLARAGAASAGLLGRAGAKGWLWRAARDQVANPAPAQAAFGYAPRRFEP